MIDNMLPYESMLEHILKTFLASEVDAQTIFSEERAVKKVAIIVFSSNSSLCGGFNANIIKMFQTAAKEYAHLGQENILVYPIGRKIAEKVNK
jgi:F-type H+-transporting ATPase subunit gamma